MRSGFMAVPGYPQTSVDMGCGRNIEGAVGVSVNKQATGDREEFWPPPECCRRCNEMLRSDMCNDATPDFDNPRGRSPESLPSKAQRGCGNQKRNPFPPNSSFRPDDCDEHVQETNECAVECHYLTSG